MKYLREIAPKVKNITPDSTKKSLEGVNKSTEVAGSTGTDPGVDYAAKAPAERDFVANHKTLKHDERTGNKDDVRNGSKIKYSLKNIQNKNMGSDKKEAEKVYENLDEKKKKPSDSKPLPSGEVPNNYQNNIADAPGVI